MYEIFSGVIIKTSGKIVLNRIIATNGRKREKERIKLKPTHSLFADDFSVILSEILVL